MALPSHSRPFALAAVLAASLAGVAHAEMASTADPLPGKDRPPVGRSLFDYMALSDDGAKFDVPFPFEALVERIKSRTGSAPKVTLIPKGRSLQRDKATFDHPRIVAAFDAPGKQTAGDLGYQIKDRLYLGYAEKADQVEVISYNEAAGRFEFQIVKDYRDGGAKQLAYASRGLCTKCHHAGAPIFSEPVWRETNGVEATDHKLADLIKGAAGGDKYHGYEVATSRTVPYDVDQAVRNATILIPTNRLWQDACGRDAEDAPRCRGLTLRFAIEKMFTTPSRFSQDSAEYAALKAMWEKNFEQVLGGGLIVRSPVLALYDPLEETGTNDGFPDLGPGLTPQEAERIKEMLKHSQVPREKDPLFTDETPLAVWKMNQKCYGKCLIFNLEGSFFTDADKAALRQAAGNDFSKVTAVLDQMIAAKDPLLGNRAFRRTQTMKALLAKLGAAAPAGHGEDAPAMPAPAFDEEQPGNTETPIATLKSYCLPCHTELPGSKGFLKGTDEEIMAALTANDRKLAKEIFKRLNWEAPEETGHKYMPPKDSDPESPRSRLTAKPEDRKAMMDWVKQL